MIDFKAIWQYAGETFLQFKPVLLGTSIVCFGVWLLNRVFLRKEAQEQIVSEYVRPPRTRKRLSRRQRTLMARHLTRGY